MELDMLSDIKLKTDKTEIKDGETIIVIPVKDSVPIPGSIIPINADSIYLTRILEEAHIAERDVIMLTKKDKDASDLTTGAYHEVGAVGRVIQILKIPGMGIKAILHPVKRASVTDFQISDETLYASIVKREVTGETDSMTMAALRIIKRLFNEYSELTKTFSDDLLQFYKDENDSVLSLVDTILSNIQISADQKQELLEEQNLKVLISRLHIILVNEIDFARLEKRIESEVSGKIMKEQKEYFIREKLRGIRNEISNDEPDTAEVEKLKKMIDDQELTELAQSKALADIEKLKRLHSMSPEYGLIRDYLDLVASLPWKKSSSSEIDIDTAEKILDEDHFGLVKPKERIIEFISILKLVNKIKGPIICLVGPPGVGKTSLGKSIARALNREYIRVALGGIHDEAEIRGHRRTYIGAMPGKIIQSIKKCGVNNPLFLLDEIDKLSTDFRGDPASALLEVLDPEQNNSFVDNYLDVEFDLSHVLFIATANDKSRIPQPLLDRMEIIDLDGYLDVEKFHIATDFIIKKQLLENGLADQNIKISDEAVYKIISDYTMEAGVRELERKIAKICRRSARKILKHKESALTITPANLDEYLGIPRYVDKTVTMGSKIGEVNGLAWTAAGGTVLKVETNLMEGKEKLNLTGKLGEVMKESAQAALSYIRANAKSFNLKAGIFEKTEIDLHFPEGAVPKDGPSAGITIVISLLSAFKNILVDQSLSMTGEVTIHGDVLPIGGLNAKLMAAKRTGIKTVIIPELNKKDLTDIAPEIKDALKIITVKHVNEVIKYALNI